MNITLYVKIFNQYYTYYQMFAGNSEHSETKAITSWYTSFFSFHQIILHTYIVRCPCGENFRSILPHFLRNAALSHPHDTTSNMTATHFTQQNRTLIQING